MVYFCIAKGNLELLFLCPSDCWDYTHGPPIPGLCGAKDGSGCSTNNCSTSQGLSLTSYPTEIPIALHVLFHLGPYSPLKGSAILIPVKSILLQTFLETKWK